MSFPSGRPTRRATDRDLGHGVGLAKDPGIPRATGETLITPVGQVTGMNDKSIARAAAPILADEAGYLIATAARAPSVHNTQPWRFRVGQAAIELYCDQHRKLRLDPTGREMLISCGAALFGLRRGMRSRGYLPV